MIGGSVSGTQNSDLPVWATDPTNVEAAPITHPPSQRLLPP